MVAQERVPYVEARRNADGTVRYVWNRKGFAAKALGSDRDAAMVEARKLNNMAERGILNRKADALEAAETTLLWYADRFEQSGEFKSLAHQTQLNYRVALKTLRETFPTQKIIRFRKRDVKRYLETIESIGGRRVAKNVMRQLFEMALDDELIDRNPVDNVSLPGVKARRQLWSDEAIDTFMASCDVLDVPSAGYDRPGRAEAMRRAMRLLEHTGQRPSDVLRMKWSDDDGEYLRVRQKKTGKIVDIYRGELGAMLDEWRAALPVTPATDDAPYARIVHAPGGQSYSMKWFDPMFRRVAAAAKIVDLQARDLRRTAVTRLYEAGCSEGLISAITGHDIETCRGILEHYYVRTRKASREAVTKLDEYRARRRKMAASDE
ncbi:MAG TPA: tyrosine-type recombinase/integrase [Stellaceae bacterium]|nr:tyrosine-type recombinase/integrase [Stellaceae bacterium]